MRTDGFKSGDFVYPSSHMWVVGYVIPDLKDVAGLKDGNYVFLIREMPSNDSWTYCLVHEDDLLAWEGPTSFDKGEQYVVAGKTMTVYDDSHPFVTILRRADSTFLTLWRWQLALLLKCGSLIAGSQREDL